MSNSLQPHGLEPTRLLCPWDFPGINTRVSCHFPPQGIFPTQGSSPCFPYWQAEFFFLPLSRKGSPMKALTEEEIQPCRFFPLHQVLPRPNVCLRGSLGYMRVKENLLPWFVPSTSYACRLHDECTHTAVFL